jgi:septation ring formation regulator EzrA
MDPLDVYQEYQRIIEGPIADGASQLLKAKTSYERCEIIFTKYDLAITEKIGKLKRLLKQCNSPNITSKILKRIQKYEKALELVNKEWQNIVITKGPVKDLMDMTNVTFSNN